MSIITLLLISAMAICVQVLANIASKAIFEWHGERRFNARIAEFEASAQREADRMMAFIEEKRKEAMRKDAN